MNVPSADEDIAVDYRWYEPRHAGAMLWGMPTAVMFVVLIVASCTTTQNFNEIYSEVTWFFSLGGTAVAKWLRAHSEFGHFISYALLSLSLSGLLSRKRLMVAPMITIVFGMLMEVVQIFIPSRDASFLDIGINILGVMLGFGVYHLLVVARVHAKNSA